MHRVEIRLMVEMKMTTCAFLTDLGCPEKIVILSSSVSKKTSEAEL